MNPHKPVAFAVKQTSDHNDQKTDIHVINVVKSVTGGKIVPWDQMQRNRKQEAVKDESGRNQHEKNKSINKKKKKAVHLSNLTVEEAYSDFDIGSNIFSLTTVAFRGGKISSLPSSLVIFDSGADFHVSNNIELFMARNPPEFSKAIGIEGKKLQLKLGIC